MEVIFAILLLAVIYLLWDIRRGTHGSKLQKDTSQHATAHQLPKKMALDSKPPSDDAGLAEDFLARLRVVESDILASLLAKTVTEFERLSSNMPDLSRWFMEYSPQHKQDLLYFSDLLSLRIRAHQLNGQMMEATPLMVLMHTAKGISEPHLNGIAVKIWNELLLRGTPKLADLGFLSGDEPSEDELKKIRNFKPLALFEFSDMLNKSDEASDILNDLSETVLSTLEAQITLAGRELTPDNFVIGYIGGYCDALLQMRGIDNNSPEGLGLVSVVFLSMFGSEEGAHALNKLLTRQEDMPVSMLRGMVTGGQDINDWLIRDHNEDRARHPMSLFSYLSEKYQL